MQRVAEAETPHLFTVAEYMALEIEERTELLGGVIYDMSPKNSPHSHAVLRLTDVLAHGLFGSPYIVQVQDPIAVSGWHGPDAPEIDIAIIAREEYPITPSASDAFVFIEVSDTTYDARKTGDRTYKIPLYVNAGVPSWIVNIPLRQAEYYETVEDLDLPHGHVFGEDATIEILGVAIPVASLFLKKNP
jgi:Uma2 family endonuclease